MKKILLIVIGIIIALHLLLLGAVYVFHWSNPYSRLLMRGLNLPIMVVDGQTLSAHDYDLDARAIATTTETKDLPANDQKKILWNKNVNDLTTIHLMQQSAVVLEQATLQKIEGQVMSDLKLTQATPETFKTTLGYTRDAFIERVIVPYARQLQLQKHYLLSEPNDARQAIEQYLQELKKDPKVFESLVAKQDSGAKPLEHLVPETDLIGDYEHLKQVPVGSVGGIVASSDGYRVYKVIAILQDGPTPMYRLEELFVPATIFQEKLNEAVKKASITVYDPSIIPTK